MSEDETGATVALPERHRRLPRLSLVIGMTVFVIGSIALWNFATVGVKISNVIRGDARNAGISVSAHNSYYLDPTTVVLDVRGFDNASCMDMFRVLFNFAKEMRANRYSRIVLEHRGTAKFLLTGDFFRGLGDDFAAGQNPMYLIRTFPENTYSPNGSPAFGHWEGGLLGVLGKQMGDVNDFCHSWLDLPQQQQTTP